MKRAALILGGLLAFTATWAGCSQNAVTVPIRSLERSGKAAFLCIRNNSPGSPGLPLDQCHTVSPALAVNDFIAPHVISLVTQTTRGEVAVVDVTASGVVDLDPSVPGFNFLPVGAQPTDVVATPGSSAAFVSVADPNRSGIFGIATAHLFPEQNGGRGPTLASLPSCGLPSAPTEMVLVRDLSPGAAGRARCDASLPVTKPSDDGYSLAAETALYGPLKLVVTLPEVGKMVVIDAQELLARKPGTFDACPIESTLDLTNDVPLSGLASTAMAARSSDAISSDAGDPVSSDASDAASVDEGAAISADASGAASADEGGAEGGPQDTALADAGAATGAVCPGRKESSAPFGKTVHLSSMAYADDGRIFVSDDGVSAIHVVDATDPCHLSLQPALLPIARADLGRAVLTGPLAVSPLTTDRKRFVYAVDLKDNGSVMIFDVSEGSTDRTPLLRPDREHNQVEPPDRMAFGAAVQSLTFGTHEIPLEEAVANVGQVPRGLKCDPVKSADMNDPSHLYAPVGFLSTGAGPRTLRGTFGFLVLATAQVMVIDLDDYDAACRRPLNTDDKRLGCHDMVPDGTTDHPAFPAASQEVSCNVVEPHRARSSLYISNLDEAGRHAPAMQTFPLLRDKDGTVLSVDPTTDGALTRPKLLGPCLGGTACSCSSDTAKQPPQEDLYLASVSGGTTTAADFCPTPYKAGAAKPVSSDPVASRNWVAFDLTEPRAHSDQAWSITFEGVLSSWLASRRGRLECAKAVGSPTVNCERGTAPSHFTLFDSDAGFCDHGAQGADLAKSQGQGITSGDIVQILDALIDPADAYWGSVAGICTPDSCLTQYGTPDQPVVVSSEKQITDRGLDPNQTWLRRDLLVTKSFQDRLDLEPSFASSDPGAPPLTCCFPYPVTYAVRGGSQWVVNGSVVGFEHHLVPDPNASDSSTAACVVSCDANLVLRNGRVARRPADAAVPNDPPLPMQPADRTLFKNEALKFVVWDPLTPKCDGPCLQRDMSFAFQEVGGFSAMAVSLSINSLVTPQSISFVPGLSQLAIPDATSQGLILVDLQRIAATQSIF